MLIFKEIEELFNQVKERRITLLDLEGDARLDEQRLELLMGLAGFINEFSWLKHRALVAKVKTFLRSHYSYEGVAKEHGMTVKSAHKCISYANAQLRDRTGGVLELIKVGNVTAAKRELAVLNGVVDTSSFFVKDITDRFHPAKDAGVVLGEDSRRELTFLSLYSRKSFEGAVARLDERTVRHILYILMSTDVTYLREKESLWQCLVDGSRSIDDFIHAQNENFLWGRVSDSHGAS
ncbi:hypothetical protein JZ785_14385 [Alicyclobacillus curvatus]|nr:hypothetical protein JZ785_14385 [Alicyclobacillus curvatus]